MTTKQSTMSVDQYRAAIDRLGLSQVRAGALFGISPRQSQRIAAGDYPVPRAVAIALELMLALPDIRRKRIIARYSAEPK